MSEIEFLVKLRDAATMILDAANERLKKLAPPGCERGQGIKWTKSKIKWQPAEGASGQYEKSDDVNNPEFKVMLQDLVDHQGKLSRDGLFFWKFDGKDIAGCKPRAKK